MYDYEIELDNAFAGANPEIIAEAREKISLHVPVIRYRCPRCGQKGSIPKDSFTGRSILAFGLMICGPCNVPMYLSGSSQGKVAREDPDRDLWRYYTHCAIDFKSYSDRILIRRIARGEVERPDKATMEALTRLVARAAWYEDEKETWRDAP